MMAAVLVHQVEVNKIVRTAQKADHQGWVEVILNGRVGKMDFAQVEARLTIVCQIDGQQFDAFQKVDGNQEPGKVLFRRGKVDFAFIVFSVQHTRKRILNLAVHADRQGDD